MSAQSACMTAPSPLSSRPQSLSETAEAIARCTLFKGVKPESLQRLAEGARRMFLPRNAILYHQGQRADDLFIVVSGQIGMFLPMANGAQKIIVLAHACDPVCEATAYLGIPQNATAVAKMDTHLFAISGETLRQQAQQDADLACRLLDAMSKRVMGLISDIASSAPRSSLQRLSHYLLQFQPAERPKAYDLTLPASKRDIAAKLNLAQASLSRTLGQLVAMEVIEVKGRQIQVRDGERLAVLCLHDEADAAD